MSWQILLTISVLSLAFSSLLQRVLLKGDKSDPIAFSIIFQALTGFLIGIYWLMSGGHIFLNGINNFQLISLLPNFILMVLLFSIGNILMCFGFKFLEASKMTILFASRAGWTVLGSALILQQTLSVKQFFGAFLIIASVILVSLNKTYKFTFSKGEKFAFLAALFFGLAVVNDAYVMQKLDVGFYMMIAFVAPAIFQVVIFPKKIKEIKKFFNFDFFTKLIILGFFYALSAVTFFMSYQFNQNAAQISVLNQTVTVVTVLLAIIFLKEKANLARKLFGAFLSFVGVVMMK